MFRLGLFLFTALLGNASNASPCVADLEDAAHFIAANDAGARDHLASHGPAIATAFDTARRAAKGAPDDAACDGILNTYVLAWRPTHMGIVPARWSAGAAPSVQPAPPEPPSGPRFQALGKDTALLVLPSFGEHLGNAVPKLLAEHRTALAARKYWIIDVRGNSGGSDAHHAPLRPWLFDGPLQRHGVEFLVTPANIQAQQDACLRIGNPQWCVQMMAPVAARMRSRPMGSFALMAERPVVAETVVLEPRRPQRVAVLADGGCASSCEQFVLDARASYRVKIAGRPTMGAIDYANGRYHALPSGRTLFYATSRSTRLPAMRVEGIGIAPDVLLPSPRDAAARDAEVARVQRWLEGGLLE